jgi:transcription initiation factor IIE alpha subunit
MREKKELYKDEILQILDMLINVARDVTLKFYNDYIANYRNKNKSKTESDSIVKYSKELTKIANYSKDEITKVCERYEYVFPSSVDFSLLGILVDCRTLK